MENKELFNKYDEGHHWENHPTIYAEEFLEFLKKNMHPCVLANDVMIVDLGCGTGRDVNHFHQAGVSAMGVDSNEEAISVAQRNYPESRFCYCDIHQLPYMDKRPLAYFCINVMHYVDAPKVMEEIYKTLIPGEYAFLHFNLLIVDQEQIQDYHQEIAEVYTLVKKFQIVDKKIFSREDSKPMPHIHNILQIIIKKI